MHRFLVTGCALLLLWGAPLRAEDYTQQRIQLLHDLADALEKNDENAVLSLAEKLKENARKLEESKKQAEALLAKAKARAEKAFAASGTKVDLSALGLNSLKGEAELKELIKYVTIVKAAEEKDPNKALENVAKITAAAKKLEDLKLTEEEKQELLRKYKTELDKLGIGNPN